MIYCVESDLRTRAVTVSRELKLVIADEPETRVPRAASPYM